MGDAPPDTPSIETAAPQFLVERLDVSLAFYEDRLGFSRDFVYEGFYAGVSRDRALIHLKCAPKLAAERAHRRAGDHLVVPRSRRFFVLVSEEMRRAGRLRAGSAVMVSIGAARSRREPSSGGERVG